MQEIYLELAARAEGADIVAYLHVAGNVRRPLRRLGGLVVVNQKTGQLVALLLLTLFIAGLMAVLTTMAQLP